jgi:hypothetical protein
MCQLQALQHPPESVFLKVDSACCSETLEQTYSSTRLHISQDFSLQPRRYYCQSVFTPCVFVFRGYTGLGLHSAVTPGRTVLQTRLTRTNLLLVSTQRPRRFDALDFSPWPQYRLATRSGFHVSLWFRGPAEGRITLLFGDSRNKQTSGQHNKADRVLSEVNSRAERGNRTN